MAPFSRANAAQFTRFLLAEVQDADAQVAQEAKAADARLLQDALDLEMAAFYAEEPECHICGGPICYGKPYHKFVGLKEGWW